MTSNPDLSMLPPCQRPEPSTQREGFRSASQLSKLNRQRPRRRASPIHEQLLPLLTLPFPLPLPRQRQPKRLINPLPHRRDPHPQRRRFFKTHAVRDLQRDALVRDEVLGEGAVFLVADVAAVRPPGDAVARLESGIRVRGGDHAGVVAAGGAAGRAREGPDVLPVGGVEGDGDGFDEDVVRAEGGEGGGGDGGGAVGDFEGVHAGHCGRS